MSTQAFRGDSLKLCAAGNCTLLHNMMGIFESLENSLRLRSSRTVIPNPFISNLPLCYFQLLHLCLKHFLVY